jgi:hypothetical protein
MKAAKRGEGEEATLALADLLLPAGVRGRLNSTYEDDCLPLARDFVRRLGWRRWVPCGCGSC